MPDGCGAHPEVERAEAHVSALETNLAAQEKKLESLGPDADFTKETSLHAELSKQLSQAINHWESVTHELESLRRLQGA